MAGKAGGLLVCVLVAVLLAGSSSAARHHSADHAAIALNILPPGESGSGGVHATDQERLYNALTPLRGNVTAQTLRKDFKPETLGATGKTKREPTPHKGVRILRDSLGRPARLRKDPGGHRVRRRLGDRRGPPPDPAAAPRPGPRSPRSTGRPTISPERSSRARRPRALAAQIALAAGLGEGRGAPPRRRRLHRRDQRVPQGAPARRQPWTRNDVIAIAALLGARFGRAAATRRAARSSCPRSSAARRGRRAARSGTTCASRTTPSTPVDRRTQVPVRPAPSDGGQRVIDAGSLTASARARRGDAAERPAVEQRAAGRRERSATGHPLFVAGPQVGYFYPGGPLGDRPARRRDRRPRRLVPGPCPTCMLGRGQDYAWSATSASTDIIDQFVETLCGGDDTHYLYKGAVPWR